MRAWYIVYMHPCEHTARKGFLGVRSLNESYRQGMQSNHWESKLLYWFPDYFPAVKYMGRLAANFCWKRWHGSLCVGEWWSVICVLFVGYITQPLRVSGVFFFFFFKGTNHNHTSLLSIFLFSYKHHNIGCYFFLTPLSSFRILYNLLHQTPVVSLKFGFILFYFLRVDRKSVV